MVNLALELIYAVSIEQGRTLELRESQASRGVLPVRGTRSGPQKQTARLSRVRPRPVPPPSGADGTRPAPARSRHGGARPATRSEERRVGQEGGAERRH